MPIHYTALQNSPRILMEACLRPVQGDRFQPTGFPDLGPSRYTLPNGTEMLLVESAQSVANRMELACWDEQQQDLIPELKGLPYVVVQDGTGKQLTNSLLEAHRINSEYIMKVHKKLSPFGQSFQSQIGYTEDSPVQWKKFHEALFQYDPNSLIHGVFLEEIGGRLRVARSLSGFIEASGIGVAPSGGVKNNIVQPQLKGGAGNVPFPRTEFVAQKITAYFNLDLALLRGYALATEATELLIALALFKVRRFLSTGLRLRTACDLTVVSSSGLTVTAPSEFLLPSEEELLAECKDKISICKQKGLLGEVTTVVYTVPSATSEKSQESNSGEAPVA